MNRQEFEEIFSDTEFVRSLLLLETGEEVREALASKGVKLTEDILDRFSEVLADELERKIANRRLSPAYENAVVGGVSEAEKLNSKNHSLPSEGYGVNYSKSWLIHNIKK